MKLREILTWKFVVYRMLLPLLRTLGLIRADAVLTLLGRSVTNVSAIHRRKLTEALARTGARSDLAAELAVGELRFLARDYLLEGRSRADALDLFDVEGGDALREAVEQGRGAGLVGSHFGAHISAFHWFYDQLFPIKLMVQRPKHVTSRLARYFDGDEADPQSNYFLRRSLPGSDCVKRLLHARNALKRGKVLYLAGDIPWQGGNTRAGQLLGRPLNFLSVWAELASNARSPVFFVFCSHQAGGRFSLKIESFDNVQPGGEAAAVRGYLERLDVVIRENPADAVAHLLWPCFGAAKPESKASDAPVFRPSRKAAPIAIP